MKPSLTRARKGAQSGQMLVVFALTLSVFIGAAALGVDLSHVRSEVERAQHAANAAALAGVVFMPNFQAQAFYRANEEATKNGFTTSATRNVTVTPSTVAGHAYRLRVTVSEPVDFFFGHLFGIGRKQITVSATAEFLPPLQMGSPDYVLGFPRFPSFLTSQHSPQNFILTQNGQYTWKENGDPYSPFFESFKNNGYGSSVTSGPDPCTSSSTPPAPDAATTCPGKGVTNNQLANAGSSFDGYKYVISIPDRRTVLVKLFDPFSELNYDGMAKCWDSGKQGAPTAYKGYYGTCNSIASTVPPTPLAPENIKPKFTAGPLTGQCIMGNQGGGCRNELLENDIHTGFNPGPTTGRLPENTLEFSLTGPAQSLLDPALTSQPVTMTTSASTDKCASLSENCVLSPTFDAGDDPTTCNSIACTHSLVSYKFVNYAILNGPGYFQLKVRSVVNQDGTGTYGESNNSYGIAVCNATNDATYAGGTPLGTSGTNGSYNYVTSDPVSTDSGNGTPGWNPNSCPSPNDSTRCPDPRLAAPGSCVQIYGEGKLPLYNYLAAGSSLIPLGYIPPDYAGHTIDVDLFDPGDVGSSSATPSSIFGCNTPTTSSDGVVPENSMEVLTPAGDLQCATGSNHVDGSNVTLNGNTQPSSLPYTFYTQPDMTNPSTGYASTGVISETASAPLDVGNGDRRYNGSWVHEKIAIPSTYDQIVNGNGAAGSAFGAYWKVLYRLGGDSTDVTVWTLSVEGSTVHLVNPSS